MRLADYIVKFLEKKGIDTIFTVSGGGSIFLCDALYKSKKLQYISHHHEQAASFAAESSLIALAIIGIKLPYFASNLSGLISYTKILISEQSSKLVAFPTKPLPIIPIFIILIYIYIFLEENYAICQHMCNLNFTCS